MTFPFRLYKIGPKHSFSRESVKKSIVNLPIEPLESVTDYEFNSYFCLELIPTTRCNLNCIGCIAKSSDCNGELYDLPRSPDMSEEMMIKSIETVVSIIEKRIINGHIKSDEVTLGFFITGGEPFLNADNLFGALLKGKLLFEEMAFKYGKKPIYDPQIVTNGLLIEKRHYEAIKNLNALITISFDTPYNRNKIDYDGKSHRHEAAKNFIELYENGHRRISLNLCVAAEYVNNLDFMMGFLDGLGVLRRASSIHISPLSPPIHLSANSSDKGVISSFKLNPHSSKQFSQKLIQYSRLYNVDIKLYRMRLLSRIKCGGLLHRCGVSNNKFCVTPDGKVYACHMLSGIDKYLCGNIENSDIMNDSRYVKIREEFDKRLTIDLDPCKDCVLQTLCIEFIDCPARNILENGNMRIVGSHQCLIAKDYLLYLLEDIIKAEYNDARSLRS